MWQAQMDVPDWYVPKVYKVARTVAVRNLLQRHGLARPVFFSTIGGSLSPVTPLYFVAWFALHSRGTIDGSLFSVFHLWYGGNMRTTLEASHLRGLVALAGLSVTGHESVVELVALVKEMEAQDNAS
jgi:hypothetical protein